MQEDFRPVVTLVAAQIIALSAHCCVLPNTCFGRELNIPILHEVRFPLPYYTYDETRYLTVISQSSIVGITSLVGAITHTCQPQHALDTTSIRLTMKTSS